jgi:hypothetical protein
MLLIYPTINKYKKKINILRFIFPKMIGSRFRVQGLPAFGGAVGDQGSKVIMMISEILKSNAKTVLFHPLGET